MQNDQLLKFLSHLLSVESGIEPAKFDWYRDNWQLPAIDYWRVESPGRLWRDPKTGAGVRERITIAEYFRRLGVEQLFDPNEPGCLLVMQYQVINPWGFVGYQFGESLLIDLGYYQPVAEQDEGINRDCWYVKPLDNSHWIGQNRRVKLQRHDGASGVVLTSDINEWRGTFTGKDGVKCFSDIRHSAIQKIIIQRALAHNYHVLQQQLKNTPANLAELVDSDVLSGVLAAAHLCGCEAVGRFLCADEDAADETNTTISDYIRLFSGYHINPYRFSAPVEGQSEAQHA